MKYTIPILICLILFCSCKQDFIKIKSSSTKTEETTVPNQTKSNNKTPNSSKPINKVPAVTTPNSSKTEMPKGGKIDKAKANSKINPNKIDLSLLEALLHNEINKVRKKNRLPLLVRHRILEKAAVDQNNYCLKNTDLTHSQNLSFKRTLPDRIKYYGGNFQVMAENLIYEGFTVRSVNGVKKEIITPTYEKMAKVMTKNWLNSPPHRKNIMSGEVDRVGNAIAYNPQNHAIYATQVFGKE